MSLIFCKIYHINFQRLYTILSVTSMLTLVLALASVSLPVSLFHVSPLLREDAEGVEPGLHVVLISLHQNCGKVGEATVGGAGNGGIRQEARLSLKNCTELIRR